MFNKYDFTKDWRNSFDFPTIETDEAQIRDDMQVLHDESRAALHALIDELAAETAGAHIGAKDANGTPSTIEVLLQTLLLVKHTHGNLDELERLVTAFNGMSVTESLVADPSKVPTSQAVIDQLDAIGAGDMAKRVYDPQNQATDIFKFAEDLASEKAEEVHNHDASAIDTGVLSPERGGTGKATLHDALIAMLASGDIILDPSHIYKELPTPSVPYRLILKEVT